MRAGVAGNTQANGKISWKGVREYMLQHTSRTLGMQQLKAKWEQLSKLKSQFSMAILDSVQPIVQKREPIDEEDNEDCDSGQDED